jgi:hypothetical protein
MKVIPYGMVNCERNAKRFNPKRPVKICFMASPNFGMALGFSQMLPKGKGDFAFASFIFSPRIRPIEYEGGFIAFKAKTFARFKRCFVKVYGVEPKV